MRILIAHNAYRERGGEDAVFERERALLEAHGHDVIVFHRENDAIRGGLGTAVDAIWNREAHRTLRTIVRRERPDVAHFHNTMPRISPSGYHAAHELEVPVVQTLHNYRLLCPSGVLHRDGAVCTDCIGRRIKTPAIAHRCYRSSAGASAAVAAMLTVHGLRGTWRREVDAWIALSEFSRALFVENGVPADRLHVKPNFVEDTLGPGDGSGGFALFVGRLVEEKGVRTILEAWSATDGPAPDVPLVIAGDGPLAEEVRAASDASNGRIEFLGRTPPGSVAELMRRAAVLLFPSTWYEPFGLTMIEAFAAGTPVLGADLGGVSSIVEDGVSGRLHAPGDAVALRATLAEMLADVDRLASMRRAARSAWRTRFSPEVNHDRLLEVYAAAGADDGRPSSRRDAHPTSGDACAA